jgi:hypothetical protein
VKFAFFNFVVVPFLQTTKLARLIRTVLLVLCYESLIIAPGDTPSFCSGLATLHRLERGTDTLPTHYPPSFCSYAHHVIIAIAPSTILSEAHHQSWCQNKNYTIILRSLSVVFYHPLRLTKEQLRRNKKVLFYSPARKSRRLDSSKNKQTKNKMFGRHNVSYKRHQRVGITHQPIKVLYLTRGKSKWDGYDGPKGGK